VNESKGKVLVIDDEAVIREGCKRVLSKDRWEVLLASDGEKGLQMCQGVDVVLLDLKMPGPSGMDVLEELLKRDPSLPIIVITGYATVDSAVEAMKKGAYDFIPKPFTPDQLRLVVQRAYEKRWLEKEAERLRQEAERTLQDVAREKGRLMTVIECMADGVLLTDHQGRIALLNPAATRLLGIREREEVIGKPLWEVVEAKQLREAIEEALNSGTSKVISQEIKRSDLWIRAHTASVKDLEGHNMGTVTVLEDLSHLLELEKMRNEFIGMVSHELRAPLSAIEQMINVVLMKEDLGEKERNFLSRAKERLRGLVDFINKLLEVSRIEAGMAIQRREPLDLKEVVQKAVDLFSGEALNKGLTFSVELPQDPLPLILGDPQGLEGVFVNLISNAIKYTPPGGKITVSLTQEGDYLKVSVSDTGVGIPKEDLPRIFDKFYRVRTKETRQVIGTGLGLAIVKGIVEAHLGKIEVKSELGKGSVFTVYLPKRV
jgi:two-component system phosphate regulon sensor histidine kinase PhoR